jgi:hypothetical protein
MRAAVAGGNQERYLGVWEDLAHAKRHAALSPGPRPTRRGWPSSRLLAVAGDVVAVGVSGRLVGLGVELVLDLADDPDELLAGTGADRPVVAVRVQATVGRPGASAQARWRRSRAAEWPSGPGACPGGSPPSSASVPPAGSSAAW